MDYFLPANTISPSSTHSSTRTFRASVSKNNEMNAHRSTVLCTWCDTQLSHSFYIICILYAFRCDLNSSMLAHPDAGVRKVTETYENAEFAVHNNGK